MFHCLQNFDFCQVGLIGLEEIIPIPKIRVKSLFSSILSSILYNIRILNMMDYAEYQNSSRQVINYNIYCHLYLFLLHHINNE